MKSPDAHAPDRDRSPPAACEGPTSVTVNGVPHAVPVGSSALDLVVALGLTGRPLAVEVNGRVVPRANLGDCRLVADSVIEIVTLVGGG